MNCLICLMLDMCVMRCAVQIHAGLHAEALSLCIAALGGAESLGGCRLQAEVTAFWIQLNSEAKFNREVADAFIRKGLFLLPEVDAYVAKMLLQTRTQALGDFAVLLARTVRDGLAGYADVSMSLDLLGKLSAAAGTNEGILQLLSAARASSRQRASARAGLPDLPGLKDKVDPPGFQQQVAQLFEDFARRAMANPEEKRHTAFVNQLRGTGLLNMDETTDRMLRILVELAVNHCLQVCPGRPVIVLAFASLQLLHLGHMPQQCCVCAACFYVT
jgi:CCR4-NOT transcription complex subunit 1